MQSNSFLPQIFHPCGTSNSTIKHIGRAVHIHALECCAITCVINLTESPVTYKK